MLSNQRTSMITIVITLFLVLALSACTGSSKSDSAVAESKVMNSASTEEKLSFSEETDNSMANKITTTSGSAPAAQAPEDQLAASAGREGAGGVGPIADPGTGMNRKVIYKANVTMKVPSFDSAEEKLRNAIHQSGAYILQFSNSMDEDEKGATYVIKVPASGFSSFIDELRGIEKNLQLQMEGSDVTEEYVDLEARLQAKKTVEARLLAFMDKATGSDDLVRFSSELATVQEQIEQLKGRMRFLDQNVAYSTVNVRLYEGKGSPATKEDGDGLGARLAGAANKSAETMLEVGEALLVFLAGLLPVAAIAALVGVPVYLTVRNRRLRRAQSIPAIQTPEPLPDKEE